MWIIDLYIKLGLLATTYCSYFARARVRARAYLLFDIGKFTLKLLARYFIYRQLLVGGMLVFFVSSNKLTFTLLVQELDLLVIVETIKSRSDKKGPLIDAITQN
jgi:hypothetical protein